MLDEVIESFALRPVIGAVFSLIFLYFIKNTQFCHLTRNFIIYNPSSDFISRCSLETN